MTNTGFDGNNRWKVLEDSCACESFQARDKFSNTPKAFSFIKILLSILELLKKANENRLIFNKIFRLRIKKG